MATKKRPEMVREPMWDIDDISARLGLKPNYLRNHIVNTPGFPKPDKVSGNVRFWWQGTVEDWIAVHRPSAVTKG